MAEGKRLSGNRGILRREKKDQLCLPLKFLLKNFGDMAKSIRIHEIDEQRANLTAPLSHGGSFWEHWFDNQAPSQRMLAGRSLDEHSIWEKAVKWEILAMEGKKY